MRSNFKYHFSLTNRRSHDQDQNGYKNNVSNVGNVISQQKNIVNVMGIFPNTPRHNVNAAMNIVYTRIKKNQRIHDVTLHSLSPYFNQRLDLHHFIFRQSFVSPIKSFEYII